MKVTCSICKDLFSLYSEVCAVECGHLFHESCIRTWCKTSLTCPHCRFRLKETPFLIKFEVKKSAEKKCRESQCEQLMQDLQVLLVEEKELKLKCEQIEQKLTDLQNEAYDTEKKAKKLRYDVTVWKQEYNYMKKAHEMKQHLEKENKAMETKISLFTSLEKLIHGTDSDMYEILVGVPVTSATIEELSKFVLAMKQKLKNNQDNYKKQITKWAHLNEVIEKQYLELEERKKNVEVLNKSVQTEEPSVKKEKKRKLKRKAWQK